MKTAMKKAIVAKKIGMTQIFKEDGTLVPVTVLEAGPCVVVQKKTVEKDGYAALQVGFGGIKIKHVNKPAQGHFDKNKIEPKRVLKELKLVDSSQYDVGSEITVGIFEAGERVDVSGISKGKGFQGNIKRHGQRTGPAAHGSKYHRGVGSLSSSTTPGKVKKGKNLPGHMGNENITIQNLEIVRADSENNVLLVKGAIPGPKGAIVVVKSTVKS